MAYSQKAYGLRRARARAKINLTLHVGRPILDPHDKFMGYHPLDSLVVFADIGDELGIEAAPITRLTLQGEYSRDLSACEDNLILRAARSALNMADMPDSHFAFDLVKNLPVSSGMGGGSADSAAALRLLSAYIDLTPSQWHDICVQLGADVPVCYLSQTAHMTGIGENILALGGLGHIDAVLVNPNLAVSTAQIFKTFDGAAPQETPRPQKHTGTLLERAMDGRNDLQPIAIALCPAIADVLSAVSTQDSCQLSRMSGSGATCFGLFPDADTAHKAAANIAKSRPDWWVKPCRFGDSV
ncbi:MAG: 4-(cytidine 5'-diphospho)-2-C-methyl-D-erythritol kinase [Litorimonas sp.]